MNRYLGARLGAAFGVGILGLVLTEIANVYFIMPVPGSQRMPSIDAAYAVYSWRWPLRLVFGALVLAGVRHAWRARGWRRWMAPTAIAAAAAITYVINFRMAADHMFRQPGVVSMQPAARNTVALNRLVVGVSLNGEARAYPLQFIGYHHQVVDRVGELPVLVSYCTVCRTGRVFTPVIAGRPATFRLVGMDHFNAMLEDRATGSWWRQANGEAITGPLKGMKLSELPGVQLTLRQWLALHPASLIMQGDPAFADEYAKDYAFERGWSRKKLTGTDTASWHAKSWVVGITVANQSRAYDWNQLRREHVVNDTLGGEPVLLALGSDSVSYFAFRRPNASTLFMLRGDSLVSGAHAYALSGEGADGRLEPLNASQEFWHSWSTFQPRTSRH